MMEKKRQPGVNSRKLCFGRSTKARHQRSNLTPPSTRTARSRAYPLNLLRLLASYILRYTFCVIEGRFGINTLSLY